MIGMLPRLLVLSACVTPFVAASNTVTIVDPGVLRTVPTAAATIVGIDKQGHTTYVYEEGGDIGQALHESCSLGPPGSEAVCVTSSRDGVPAGTATVKAPGTDVIIVAATNIPKDSRDSSSEIYSIRGAIMYMITKARESTAKCKMRSKYHGEIEVEPPSDVAEIFSRFI
ncbi:hypothetical protein C8R47DRAFT_1235779 [Mycena vitilis]|nr:hypothetical protein C8R47DRAFT_1235779 [Mycena vitilis]